MEQVFLKVIEKLLEKIPNLVESSIVAVNFVAFLMFPGANNLALVFILAICISLPEIYLLRRYLGWRRSRQDTEQGKSQVRNLTSLHKRLLRSLFRGPKWDFDMDPATESALSDLEISGVIYSDGIPRTYRITPEYFAFFKTHPELIDLV